MVKSSTRIVLNSSDYEIFTSHFLKLEGLDWQVAKQVQETRIIPTLKRCSVYSPVFTAYNVLTEYVIFQEENMRNPRKQSLSNSQAPGI